MAQSAQDGYKERKRRLEGVQKKWNELREQSLLRHLPYRVEVNITFGGWTSGDLESYAQMYFAKDPVRVRDLIDALLEGEKERVAELKELAMQEAISFLREN